MKDGNNYWERFLALPVLVFAIYPFMKDFIFEYPNHTTEAAEAYLLAIGAACIIFVVGILDHKRLLKK